MTNYLKVTKKPVYEDAVQFRHDLPKSWNLCKTFVGAKWSQTRNAGFVNTAYVETPEGRTALVDGDFIVHGLNQGEFFVLSEVQFHESYDIIANMRKWEPKKGVLDDKNPWDDFDEPFDKPHYAMDLGSTIVFNDEKVGRMQGLADWDKQFDDMKHVIDDFTNKNPISPMQDISIGADKAMETMKDIHKKLSTPMDHILSDLRYQAAMSHTQMHERKLREKVRNNDKTETDG